MSQINSIEWVNSIQICIGYFDNGGLSQIEYSLIQNFQHLIT